MISREELNEALIDPAACAARRLFAHTVGAALEDTGRLLFTAGHLFGPDRKAGASPFGHGNDREVGVAMASEISGELTLAAAALITSDQLYAAMALVRQIVEVEYLLWAFGSRKAEADAWLRSSHEERLQMWMPRHLRSKSEGRFGSKDYQDHCERGGHPTPEARFLLREHGARISAEAVWLEVAQHSVGCWDYLVAAIAELENLEVYGPMILERQTTRELHSSRESWQSVDAFPALASRWKSER